MTSKRWADRLADTQALNANPLYGPTSFTPATTCEHTHPAGILRGSSDYCEVCAVYGRDGFESTYQHPDFDITSRMEKAEAEAKREAKAKGKMPAIADKKQPAKFKPRIRTKQKRRVA